MTVEAWVEVATFKADWEKIDSAEPETADGAPDALLTLWEDSEDNMTAVAIGAVYVQGKMTRMFTRKHEVLAFCERKGQR